VSAITFCGLIFLTLCNVVSIYLSVSIALEFSRESTRLRKLREAP